MTETLDTYTAGTDPDDFAEADLPDEPAGQDVTDGAPWGFTRDKETGEERPKKSPGRPRKPPTAEELAAGAPVAREPDRAPSRPRGRKPQTPADEDAKPLSRAEAGLIAAGVNKLYRRAGKLIRGLENGDPMGIGQAFIECTRIDPEVPADERELTVGEAWANLAKVNPRVRKFLLKVIAGGDVADLVMAHAPIGVALVMKPWVQRFLPPSRMMSLVESMGEEDEAEEEGTALPAGLTAEDIQQMQDLTGAQAEQIAMKMAKGMGVKLGASDLAEARRRAEDAVAGGGVPAAYRRQQPKNQSRAQRKGR